MCVFDIEFDLGCVYNNVNVTIDSGKFIKS